ncbi:Crp/Fnr family transcriptional regulator [Zeaxanthinibacter sp. PT1]|uniref:Crp/Fnr family transcriptional regulator n=1 Tax=Zeaxanthinibacter TaxID=561554 RepID=UPI00234B0CF3|nr:Crp/Fnr family transcriptional regulator [Zeaxanthinibacter sp. PT1]MDC6351685.1 Crp/Fnr family transcriptional regulator [Zeaxanthinibacter sp. PT1]
MNTDLENYAHYKGIISRNSLFRDVKAEAVHQLMDCTSIQIWPKKTCIPDPSHTLYTFYILLSGKIKGFVFDDLSGRTITLLLLSKDDVFDVFTLVHGRIHNIRYETLSQTEVLSIPLHKLKEWIQANPVINTALLKYTTEKMCALENYISELVMDDTSARFARFLHNHMDVHSRRVPILNDLNYDDLGALIGTTRTIIGRHFLQWREEGILTHSKFETVIKSPEALRKKFLSKELNS